LTYLQFFFLTKIKDAGIFLYKMKCSEQEKYIKQYFPESHGAVEHDKCVNRNTLVSSRLKL